MVFQPFWFISCPVFITSGTQEETVAGNMGSSRKLVCRFKILGGLFFPPVISDFRNFLATMVSDIICINIRLQAVIPNTVRTSSYVLNDREVTQPSHRTSQSHAQIHTEPEQNRTTTLAPTSIILLSTYSYSRPMLCLWRLLSNLLTLSLEQRKPNPFPWHRKFILNHI